MTEWTPELLVEFDNDRALMDAINTLRDTHKDNPSDPRHFKFAADLCQVISDHGYPAITPGSRPPLSIAEGRMAIVITNEDGQGFPLPKIMITQLMEKWAEKEGFADDPDWRRKVQDDMTKNAREL